MRLIFYRNCGLYRLRRIFLRRIVTWVRFRLLRRWGRRRVWKSRVRVLVVGKMIPMTITYKKTQSWAKISGWTRRTESIRACKSKPRTWKRRRSIVSTTHNLQVTRMPFTGETWSSHSSSINLTEARSKNYSSRGVKLKNTWKTTSVFANESLSLWILPTHSK